MTTLREFTSPIEAGLMQSFLQSHDIEVVIVDQYTSAHTSTVAPLILQVPDDQAEEALALLESCDEQNPPTPEA